MGLHHITEDGMLFWHCHTPTCTYHNCTHPLLDCAHHEHLPREARPAGDLLSAHISHEAVQWTRYGDMIALPTCACGRQLFVRAVFSDEELAQLEKAVEIREEYTMPVTDSRHEELRQMLAAHGIEIPGRVELVKQSRVVGTQPHPMLAHHLELARQLRAIGKLPPGEQSGEAS